MPELDRFDTRLEHAVRGFADRAQTHVDAAAVAQRASRGRRRHGTLALLGREVPVPVSMLVLLVLLLTMLIWTVAGGGLATRRGDARPAPALPAPATSLLQPATWPATDGSGDELVSAEEAPSLLGDVTRTPAGDTITITGTFTSVVTANDPRTRGTATWRMSADLPVSTGTATGFGAGPVSGTYRLEGPDGTWEGDCRGTVLDEPLAITGSCWLTGSGAYAGSTYFRMFTWRFATPWDPIGGSSDGNVYPGPAPTP